MELHIELRLRATPVAAQRALADVAQQRDFRKPEAAEEAKLDEIGKLGLLLLELAQRAVDDQEIVGRELAVGDLERVLEIDEIELVAAALAGRPRAHVIHD